MEFVKLRDILFSFPNQIKIIGEQKCLNILQDTLRELTKDRRNYTPEEDKQKMKEFRDILLPIIHKSVLCRYAYKKQKGYPGDYVTQIMIWNGRTKGDRYKYAGTSKLGKLINSMTLDMESSRANEERISILRNYIKQSGTSIASIGCGPCIEFWEIDKIYNKEIDLFLLDHDAHAIEYARTKLSRHSFLRITFKIANILKYSLRGGSCELGKRDFIYVFGLLDYLPVRLARRIILSLWEHINPGGVMVVTNAHPEHPTRLWMEYAGDWFLDYKTKQTMFNLCHDLNNLQDIKYKMDSFGVHQYLEMRAKT